MNIFKMIKQYFLDKKMSNEVREIIENHEVLIESITPQEEIMFESDSLVDISEGHFLDTTSPLAIAKYKNNLRLLVEQTRQTGKVERFKTIRNDDYFPYDWEWRVSSKNTGIEKTGSYLAYEIRTALALQSLDIPQNGKFRLPISSDELYKEMSKLERTLGMIYSPVRFRSTKHFTVNTPLSYTGEYNGVESGRNFTVIDDIEPLLKSGYAYSADYRDAYLDVTHESLKITPSAVVLIAEDKYRDIISDPVVAQQLHDRQVIVYRGDEAVAINMILTEQGVLPARPGNMYMMYDNDIREILENSMRELCANNELEYAKGHGNLFGKGGHFSDLYDGYNYAHTQADGEFIDFLQQKFPEYPISTRVLTEPLTAEKFVNTVGVEQLLAVIDEYNTLVQGNFSKRFEQYKDDRKTITPEVSMIFKRTVAAIKWFYLTADRNNFFVDVEHELRDFIRLFYHADTVEEQLLAANKICAELGISLTDEEMVAEGTIMK